MRKVFIFECIHVTSLFVLYNVRLLQIFMSYGKPNDQLLEIFLFIFEVDRKDMKREKLCTSVIVYRLSCTYSLQVIFCFKVNLMESWNHQIVPYSSVPLKSRWNLTGFLYRKRFCINIPTEALKDIKTTKIMVRFFSKIILVANLWNQII